MGNMLVKGNVMGVKVIGDVNSTDVKNFAQLAKALNDLRSALTELFDERIANALMERVLNGTHLEIERGTLDEATHNDLETLYRMGLVGKSKGQREVDGETAERTPQAMIGAIFGTLS